MLWFLRAARKSKYKNQPNVTSKTRSSETNWHQWSVNFQHDAQKLTLWNALQNSF